MSVHGTISTAVLQRFVAACVRTALAEPAGSGDVSSAFAASPDVAATKSRGCVATCDFSVSGRETHPQSGPRRHRHRNDDTDYERRASGYMAGVMKSPWANGRAGQLKAGWSRDLWKSTNKITVMGYPKIRLVA